MANTEPSNNQPLVETLSNFDDPIAASILKDLRERLARRRSSGRHNPEVTDEIARQICNVEHSSIARSSAMKTFEEIEKLLDSD